MKTKELLNSISSKNYSEAKSLLNSILDDKKAQAIKSKLKELKQIVERKFDIHTTLNWNPKHHRVYGAPVAVVYGITGFKSIPNEMILYEANPQDRQYVDRRLNYGEVLFRYTTETTDAGDLTPLIILSLERGLLYFLDTETEKFDTRGTRFKGIRFVSMNDLERLFGSKSQIFTNLVLEEKTENIKERGITKTIGDYISYARDSIEYISSPKGSEDLYAIIKDAGRYILYGVEPEGKDYKIKSFVGGFNNISRAQDYIKEIKESNQSIKEKLSNKKT